MGMGACLIQDACHQRSMHGSEGTSGPQSSPIQLVRTGSGTSSMAVVGYRGLLWAIVGYRGLAWATVSRSWPR
jgi:hypothetical protein